MPEATMSARTSGRPTPTGQFTPRERLQARRLGIVLAVVAVFSAAELAGAFLAESWVLKADALHLLMDVAALGTALGAMHLAVRKPTERFTFGLRRAEPVAAVMNAMLVLLATAVIVTEGIEDLRGTSAPHADLMLFIAIGALVVNGVSAWLIHGAIEVAHEIAEDHERAIAPHLAHDDHHDHAHDGHEHAHAHEHEHRHVHADRHHHGHDHAHAKAPRAHGAHAHGHSHSLNLRGALLHLLGDALGSVAAIVAAVLIRLGFSPKVDPIASFVVAAILVFGAVRLLRDAILVLLEAAPPHLPVAEVRRVVAATPGVTEVHELHVWSLGAGHDAITVHVHGGEARSDVARDVERAIRAAFLVEYVTVQVERHDEACEAEPDAAA